MNKKIISVLAMGTLVSGIAGAQDKMKDIEARLEALETEKSLNILKFNGALRMRYDSITKKNAGVKDHYNPARLFFNLDTTANISKKLNFYGRIGSSYVFNNIGPQRADDDMPLNSSRAERGPQLYLERAFLAYSLLDNVAINAGRLPTVDGPPAEYYDGISRSGSYPALSYNAQIDGVAISYTPFKNPAYELAFRAVYAPFYNGAFDYYGEYTHAVKGSPNSAELSEQTPFYTVMGEYTLKPSRFVENFMSIIQYNSFSHYKTNDVIARGTDLAVILASPTFGGNGVPASLTTQTMHGSTLDFDWNSLNAHFDFKNIAKSNIDFAFSYAHTTVKSRGYVESNTNIALVSSAVANALHAGQGIMTNKDSDKVEGDAFLFTAKYTTPWAHLVGAEFFKGTKGLQLFEYNSDNLTSFYSTRGNGYHAWYTMPFAEALRLRVGYTLQDHDYSKGFIGAPTKSELKENTIYSSLRFDF